MRILILSSRSPWPPERADQMTIDRMVRFLTAKGVEVDLACFVESTDEEQALRREFGPLCRRIAAIRLSRWQGYLNTAASLPTKLPMQVGYYRSRRMERAIRDAVATQGYDLVYAHLIRMAEFARDLPVPRAVGLQISQALNLQRMVESITSRSRKVFYSIEARKVRPYEALVCGDFTKAFLIGDRDRAELQKSAAIDNVILQPHGQDVISDDRLRAAVREPGAIVMSGVMATYTNVDAATWFASEVFPLVEKRVPGAQFWIVGRHPQREVLALADPGRIVVTGEVADVSEWLLRAEVGVAPLRVAAGMQNKIVQSLGAGLPVVATAVANEGIGAADGEHLLVREGAAEFADAVATLLTDADLRSRLATAGRSFVEAHWTWEAHFEHQLKVFAEVAAAGARPAASA